MNRILGWVKNNKLAVLLGFLFLGYWWLNNGGLWQYMSLSNGRSSYSYGGRMEDSYGTNAGMPMAQSIGVTTIGSKKISNPSLSPAAPSGSSDRMTVQSGSLALLVKDVRETQNKISQYVQSGGGYVVNMSTNRPSEQPYGNMSVRVMADKLDASFEYFRSLGVKVTSETLNGYDVTDQYEDLETSLGYLQRSLAQIQSIQDQAESYDEILAGTREVISLQQQIDNLKGRQLYLEQTSKLALVNISMSADEFALPYAPDSNFRPAVIFKLAVRSLLTTLQGFGTLGIWIAVYSLVWIPLIILIWFVNRIIRRRNTKKLNRHPLN